ncbi:helix-turn-helix domain-containing protein [Fibrobacter sp. UWR2]|uniref:helix-turn-helix transcriptional regulator n=1 Tax=Fibrobacter sp. UWR2 TaxID=1964352 RepID=UPI000B527B7B|nr:helix-turn-helix domain-containing protein [Fibrobacter sp. UWR2]MBR4349048.1 helix-turn-helix domain-containing protein [Fibrobacter sp.]MBR6855534.1 helix-turn-helix domain-containing protein [Fibrobacter sp.]OWU99043.1 XRE family transcriptional regulator [Fibrobacter sp. UWR2]
MARHGTPTPGQAILEGIEWLKMDKAEFARRLGVSMETLEGLIAGTVEITLELASALESVTGSPAAYWRMLASKAKKNNN